MAHQFILLTHTQWGPTYVNIERIEWFYERWVGGVDRVTTLGTGNGQELHVRETVDEIVDLLGITPKPAQTEKPETGEVPKKKLQKVPPDPLT